MSQQNYIVLGLIHATIFSKPNVQDLLRYTIVINNKYITHEERGTARKS
jgi:hypothetical protein